MSVTNKTLALLLTLSFSLIGCGGGGGSSSPTATPSPQATPNPANVSRVTVTAPASQLGLGDPLALTATIYDNGGTPISRYPNVEWSVSDPALARVDLDGKLVGFATGIVEVRVSAGGVTGRFSVTLTPGSGSWGEGYLYGGTDNDGGENIVTDTAGNVYVAATTAGTVDGQSTTYSSGQSDALVTRFLPNGKKAWTQLLLTQGQDGANGLTLHPSGGVVVASAHLFRSQITYIDPAGRVVWKRVLEGAGVNDIATDRAGNVYVTGDAQRSGANHAPLKALFPEITLPPNAITALGAGDGFLIKLSSSGAPLWCKLFTYIPLDQSPVKPIPSFDTQGVSLTLDEARGALYVGGTVQLNAYYGLSPFIRRFELADGATRWMRFINPTGTGTDPSGREGNSITGVQDRGFLHAVTVDGAGEVWAGLNEDRNNGYVQSHTAYVVKLDSEGVERLRRTVAVASSDREYQAVVALTYRPLQNDIVLVGSWGDRFEGHGNYREGLLTGMELSGTEKWRTTVVGTSHGAGQPQLSVRGVAAGPRGEVFTVGDTRDNFSGLLNASGSFDIAIAHLGIKP